MVQLFRAAREPLISKQWYLFLYLQEILDILFENLPVRSLMFIVVHWCQYYSSSHQIHSSCDSGAIIGVPFRFICTCSDIQDIFPSGGTLLFHDTVQNPSCTKPTVEATITLRYPFRKCICNVSQLSFPTTSTWWRIFMSPEFHLWFSVPPFSLSDQTPVIPLIGVRGAGDSNQNLLTV